jgi:hypothetical protein
LGNSNRRVRIYIDLRSSSHGRKTNIGAHSRASAQEELERLLREALRARRVDRLTAVRETLATNPLPPMTPEEIQAEIDDYRAQVRRASGS